MLLLPAAAATQLRGPDLPQTLENYDQQLLVYVKATSATDGRFLSLDPGASSVDAYKADASATSGASASLGTLQGSAPASWTFELTGKLPKDYWFNLSQPIQGVLNYTNTPSQTASSASVESGRIRVEIFSGNDRVGGSEYTYSLVAAASSPAWHYLSFAARPEVDHLAKGAGLSLKVTRYGGAADFTIGTGGDHPSYLEFRTFDLDPLAGSLYLEKGHLISSTSGTSLTPDTGTSMASGAILCPIILGLARRRTLAVPMVLLLGASLAGCMGGHQAPGLVDATDGTAPPTSDTPRYTDNPNGPDTPLGRLEGTIRDDGPVHLPVPSARVAVLGTSFFTIGDTSGRYAFENVTPGMRHVHVDADTMDSAERSVDVKPGKTTILDITLHIPKQKPHKHGDWKEGEVSRQIYSNTFSPAPDRPSDESGTDGIVASGGWVCPAGGAMRTPSGGAAVALFTSEYCIARIPIDPGSLVQPGTKRVTISLSWNDGNGAPKELGFAVETPARYWSREGKGGFGVGAPADPFVPRGKDVPFNVPIFPNEADAGHQTATRWNYYVYTPHYDALHPEGIPATLVSSITASIRIWKGNAPFEPAHPDLWGNKTSITIATPDTFTLDCMRKTMPTAAGNIPNQVVQYPNRDCAFLGIPQVPAGTKDIVGALTWDGAVPGTTWHLAYKSSDLFGAPGLVTREPDEVHETDGNYSFTIHVKPEMTDGFYATEPTWSFYPSDHGDDTTRASGGAGTTWHLWAVMVKDPTYADA